MKRSAGEVRGRRGLRNQLHQLDYLTASPPCDAASLNVHGKSGGTRYNTKEETNYSSHEERLLRIMLASMLLVRVT
jgi:hypothetical protein